MKKISHITTATVLVMSFLFGFSGPMEAQAATTPSLGTAGTYGVLSSTFTRNVGVTAIIGDLGYTTLSGGGTHTVSGSTFIVPPAQAGIDQGAALTNLAGQACTYTFPAGAVDLATDTTHGPIGVYTPGVYCTAAASAASIGTGGITLSGAGTFIFRVDGALTSVDNSNVTLANSASSCDVFWTATAGTTLGANTTFKGTVIDASGITVGNNTSWIGRALAFAGTVTMDTDTISSTCVTASPAPAPSTGGGGFTAPLPLINVTKVPNPLALPAGPGSVTYTYAVTNIGAVPMSSIWVRDNKCSAVNYVSGDTDADLKLDLTETWIYRCTKVVTATETNMVTAHGWTNGWDGYDTAYATVVVGAAITPPLINVVKVPSVFTLPAVGGLVTYRYTVTNPGTAPLSNVRITDDKCTGLPGRVVGHPGDLNKNNLLESNESWTFTCLSNIKKTTTNIATAEGDANGLRAIDFASATVVVAAPTFPKTGFFEDQKSTPWNIVIPAGALTLLLAFFVVRKNKLV